MTDLPGTAKEREDYPASYPGNIWPDESKMPLFKKEAKAFGSLMFQVVLRLSKHIDNYIQQNFSPSQGMMMYDELKNSEKVKARLLYYYPLSHDEENSDDSWIGWHNDSGFLTALSGDIYVDDKTGEVLDKCPDPNAGLYVMSRKGEKIKIDIPSDCMAIQLGECFQILTGGTLVATPHCVCGVDSKSFPGISRISEACFVDTKPTYKLYAPPCANYDQVVNSGVVNKKVPPLRFRWKNDGMLFGDFLQTTFKMYYEWSALES